MNNVVVDILRGNKFVEREGDGDEDADRDRKGDNASQESQTADFRFK